MDPNYADIAGKIALIKGATSGIGKVAALAFARLGANVVALGRNADAGDSVAAECSRFGAGSLFLKIDISKEGSMRTAIERSVEKFGRVDIASNNAGMQERRAPLAEQTLNVFDDVFQTNVRALFDANEGAIISDAEARRRHHHQQCFG